MRRASLCRWNRVPDRLRTKVDETLEIYANKGVFRSFASILRSNKTVTYRMKWHKERFYDLIHDVGKRTLRFPVVLPKAPRLMYEEFKKFVASRQATETIEHRRIDPKRIRISCSLKNGNISLLFTSKDNDLAYATQKIINLMHEVFMDFLRDGLYYEYMIETFDIDRDQLS
jgi:hypothetical protein